MDFEDAFFDTNDYELQESKIGEGAYGKVYKAINKKDHKIYAVKLFNSDSNFNGRQQMLILRESLTLHKLDHPSIVKFIGVNFQSFKNPKILEPAIITEFISNGSLKEIINKERKSIANHSWNATKKYIILLGVSDAMRYLHQHDILHRDLKPCHILIDENYYPKVCDFGLSRCFPETLSKIINLSLTSGIGTPLYMAPELLKGDEKYDKSVDVFAFAILAYEILTNKEPYSELGTNISLQSLTTKILSGYRPKFTDDSVTEKMKELLSNCWSEIPEERPTFDEIFLSLSTDLTYFKETVDRDEINDYIEIVLKRECKYDSFKAKSENEIFLKKQVTSLEKKCQKYENLVKKIQIENKNLRSEVDNKKINNDNWCILIDQLFQGLLSFAEQWRNYTPSNSNEFAIRNLQMASNQGNCIASYALGFLYQIGICFSKNDSVAIQYYEKAGQQGLPFAYSRIGFIYLNGSKQLFKQDVNKAIQYFQKSVDLGSIDGYVNLGSLYIQGVGVPKNVPKGIEYLEFAAQHKHFTAIYNLGSAYEDGLGVNVDYNKALYYYQMANDLGYYMPDDPDPIRRVRRLMSK